jgi:hypothetical protein
LSADGSWRSFFRRTSPSESSFRTVSALAEPVKSREKTSARGMVRRGRTGWRIGISSQQTLPKHASFVVE